MRSEWGEGDGGPERRVYKLTRKGSRQLQNDAQALRSLVDTLEDFLELYAHAWGSP